MLIKTEDKLRPAASGDRAISPEQCWAAIDHVKAQITIGHEYRGVGPLARYLVTTLGPQFGQSRVSGRLALPGRDNQREMFLNVFFRNV